MMDDFNAAVVVQRACARLGARPVRWVMNTWADDNQGVPIGHIDVCSPDGAGHRLGRVSFVIAGFDDVRGAFTAYHDLVEMIDRALCVYQNDPCDSVDGGAWWSHRQACRHTLLGL